MRKKAIHQRPRSFHALFVNFSTKRTWLRFFGSSFKLNSNASLTNADEWLQLKKYAETAKNRHISDLHAEKNRFNDFLLAVDKGEMILDYSKQNVTKKIMGALFELAKTMNVESIVKAMFEGQKINITEKRSVLHTALRANLRDKEVIVDAKNVSKEFFVCRDKMKGFVNAFRNGELKGCTGKAIDTVVNIGIGGSHLGPEFVVDALKYYGLQNKLPIKEMLRSILSLFQPM